jgi:hypothetical protein
MKEELINKIEVVVHRLGKDSFHAQLLLVIIKMLQRLKPDAKINRYEVIDDFVSIELLYQTLPEYIDIEITKNNIEIRGDGYEMIYFFDRNSFELKYMDLIAAFFKGDYKVLSYLGEKGKKEAFGVIWDNENLKSFNNQKEGVNFFEGAVKEEFSKDGLEIVA